MILCDSNIWLALILSEHQHHRAVRQWFDTIERPGTACLCRATQQSLLRLLTTAAVMKRYGHSPLTNRQAWQMYEHIQADDRISTKMSEPPRLDTHWKALAMSGLASPKVWMDAYLAGFALAGGYGLATTDRAFKAFPGLDLKLLG